jgi:hypothetical protein
MSPASGSKSAYTSLWTVGILLSYWTVIVTMTWSSWWTVPRHVAHPSILRVLMLRRSRTRIITYLRSWQGVTHTTRTTLRTWKTFAIIIDCFCLVHAVNREQEIAAPMVCSHLDEWGEKYCSHKYSTIYWSSFVLKTFPNLHRTQQ